MLTRILYKLQYHLIVFICVLGLSTQAYAHEFWLEPFSFKIDQGENLRAHIKVGQEFNGDTYGFFPANFERFDLTVNGSTNLLSNRFAQKPAVDQAVTDSGLLNR